MSETTVETTRPAAGAARSRRRHGGIGLWTALATPGTVWFLVLFVVPLYALVAVALGSVEPVTGAVRPEWNPIDWELGVVGEVLDRVAGGDLGSTARRTVLVLAAALACCVVIGFPVAYFVARRARRSRGVVLALLLVPFWAGSMARLAALAGVLGEGGVGERLLGALGADRDWLAGHPLTVVIGLTYLYAPVFVVVLVLALERLDERVIETGRDLGARGPSLVLGVVVPLAGRGLAAASAVTLALMLGDFWTSRVLSRDRAATELLAGEVERLVADAREPRPGAALALLLVLVISALAVVRIRSARDARRAVV